MRGADKLLFVNIKGNCKIHEKLSMFPNEEHDEYYMYLDAGYRGQDSFL